MIRHQLTGLVVASIFAACAPSAPEVRAHQDPIVDGTLETGYPEVMYMLNRFGAACTATLIAPRTVLTAKHCVESITREATAAPADDFVLLVGGDSDTATEYYTVREVRTAPGRWDLRDASDVALFILDEAAPFQPRQVSFDDPTTLADRNFTAIGYGVTPAGISGIKYRVQKRVEGFQDGFVYVTPAVCSGDSGGPLLGPDERIWGVASYIYSPDGMSQPVCGTAPGAYNSLAAWRTFIETAITDGGGCVPRTETCNAIDDNCDGVVDETCLALGASCSTSDSCIGGTECVAVQGQGSICTRSCADAACPNDMHCGRSGATCEALHCLPGASLNQSSDTSCTSDRDCADGLCIEGVCEVPCENGTACLRGEQCGMAAGCQICVTVTPSERPLGAVCNANEECASGECIRQTGRSSGYCAGECPCPGGYQCEANRCVPYRLGAIGSTCRNALECTTGLCARDEVASWCSRGCSDSDPCEVGFECTPASDGIAVCRPMHGVEGAICHDSTECSFGSCVADPESNESFCASPCERGQSCAAGLLCTNTASGTFCLPPTQGIGGITGGGCASTQGGLSGLLIAAFLFVGSRRRRRSQSTSLMRAR